MLVGCVSTPAKRYDDLAKNLGLSRNEITTDKFTLAVFRNAKPQGRKLHVYLEGDGTPFHRRVHINPEPTSTQAVALRLMSQDPNKAVLIGRPCYHQVEKSTRCDDSKWWTSHRYGLEVLESIEIATQRLNIENKSIVLIGFSGGGSLATLLAHRNKLPITKVITVSANLDTQAWASHNGFTPLWGSLNPINAMPLSQPNMHLFGADDKKLGFQLWQTKLETMENASLKLFPDFDHVCCWESIWPNLLQELRSQ